MTTPHEYMDEYGEWNLHSFHNSDLYEDPDYMASDTDSQLPLISTLGAGPRGAGVVVRKVEGEDGYRVAFVNDQTNEVMLETPDLEAPDIEISWSEHDMVDGEQGWMAVSVRQGSRDTKYYQVPIPAGAHGSRMFLTENQYITREDKTYIAAIADLIHYGKSDWKDKPTPRPGDIIVFKLIDEVEGRLLAFGTIEAVESDEVVFTNHTTIGMPTLAIAEDGTWTVDGVRTDYSAQGPKGEKGNKGDQGIPGDKGAQGDTGPRGLQGEPGVDGKDAVVEIGTVTTLAPGSNASVSASVDEETNVTTLNFGIPEGIAGKAIDIQGGIWHTDTLPNYNTTAVNKAFIVYDDDRQFDLYIRGAQPVTASAGGPWTVVEDWQGRPGFGVHILNKPYIMASNNGETISVLATEAEQAFTPYEYMADGDTVIDTMFHIGVLSSAEDNSGDYIITTQGKVTTEGEFVAEWPEVTDKPFETIGDGLTVDDEGNLNVIPAPPITWDTVQEKPFEIIGNGLIVAEDEDGKLDLSVNNDALIPKWDNVQDKPETYPTTWEEISYKPETYPTTWNEIDGKPETYPASWDDIEGKPESFVTSWNDIPDKPDSYPTTWDDIQNKPETVDSTWETVQNKPFESINDEDFFVDNDGVLHKQADPLPVSLDWDDLDNKPKFLSRIYNAEMYEGGVLEAYLYTVDGYYANGEIAAEMIDYGIAVQFEDDTMFTMVDGWTNDYEETDISVYFHGLDGPGMMITVTGLPADLEVKSLSLFYTGEGSEDMSDNGLIQRIVPIQPTQWATVEDITSALEEALGGGSGTIIVNSSKIATVEETKSYLGIS